ncbi:Rhomboid-like protein 14, mitochondrial [Dichanthelium oligosanthes]|uniref:Rhomboid-like protein 14, mitochondrial n=1 Tax=Dichanthelium oligosanthes TaxID=888268 RepID=A0A1E5VX16_9POAL|nr:Rhomboid-like protein 14, mitochondrial [Dichanthelium oligosanthes]
MGSGMSSGRRRGFGLEASRGMLPLLALQVLVEYGRAGATRPPVTAALLAANTLIYLRPGALHKILPSIDRVSFNPQLIVEYGDWTRFFLSPFYHSSESHLFYNMTSLLWKGIHLETSMGSAEFASMVAALLGLSQGITLLLSKGLVLLGDYTAYYDQYAVGFSGVLFAMKVVLNAWSDDFVYLHGMVIPAKYAAWAELILIQVFIPGTSFLGHLGGILAGLVYLWLKRSFNGPDPFTLLITSITKVVTWPLGGSKQSLYILKKRKFPGKGKQEGLKANRTTGAERRCGSARVLPRCRKTVENQRDFRAEKSSREGCCGLLVPWRSAGGVRDGVRHKQLPVATPLRLQPDEGVAARPRLRSGEGDDSLAGAAGGVRVRPPGLQPPPVTAALLAANVLVFLRPGPLNGVLPKTNDIALNYQLFLKLIFWDRFFLSPFYHWNELHLFCNMTTLLWTGVLLETYMGSAEFASMVAALLGLSQGITVLLSKSLSLLGSGIPAKYILWAELFLNQTLFPNSSFLGHLGGLLAGEVYLLLKRSFKGRDPLTLLISGGARVVNSQVRFAQKLLRSVLPQGHIIGQSRVGCHSSARESPRCLWRCSTCTNYNSLATDVCEMCSTMREDCAFQRRQQLSVEEMRRRRLDRFDR